MGLSNSRPMIPIGVAESRFSKEEWQRFNRAFDAVANSKGMLTKKAFEEAVLGTHMPPELVGRIFDVMAGKTKRPAGASPMIRRGMRYKPKPKPEKPLSKDAFLAGMAVILKGTEDEKLRLLFDLTDVNCSKSISTDEMYYMICLLQETELAEQIAQVKSRKVLADRIFKEVTGKKVAEGEDEDEEEEEESNKRLPDITFDQFKEWAKKNMTPGLVTWIFKISPETQAAQPDSLPTLARGVTTDGKDSIWGNRGRGISIAEATHFDEKEISDLQTQYDRILADSSGKAVSKQRLRELFPDTDDKFFEKIFTAFDANKDGIVDLKEFIVGMSSCCRGTLREKLQFCFKLFDANRDGRLSKDELISMCRSLGAMEGIHRQLSVDSPQAQERIPGQVNDKNNTDHKDVLAVEVESLIKRLCSSEDGERTVTLEEFLNSSLQSHLTMEFFNKISQMASLRLGIRPRNAGEEARVVLQLVKETPKTWLAGESVYVISYKWTDTWLRHTGLPVQLIHSLPNHNGKESKLDLKLADVEGGGGGPRPQEIDNSFVLAEGSHTDMRRGLKVGVDFVCVRPKLWSILAKWYGGGPMVQRQVIATRTSDEQKANLTVEFYPWTLHCQSVDKKLFTKCQFSRAGTLDKFKLKVCSLLQLDKNNVRLWSYYEPSSSQGRGNANKNNNPKEFAVEPELLETTMTLEDAQLVDGQRILIERRKGDGKDNNQWEGIPGAKNKKNKLQRKGSVSGFRDVGGSYKTGCVGLWNLGNTCFMNAALQCLSNTVPLTEYFLKNLYAREINIENKLGMGGRCATYYGRHIKELWQASYPVAPRGVKAIMAKKNPQFEGYQQQDSQELLMTLLDGLHEDLNRVKEKPYIQIPDSDHRDDVVVAQEHIMCYLKRNRSAIVDLFHGVIKSTLEWPEAPKADNRKFDVFNMLSLPVPEESDIRITLSVVFDNPNRAPMQVSMNLRHQDDLSEAKQVISKLPEIAIPPERLALTDVTHSYVYSFLSQHTPVRKIQQTKVYCYEVPQRLAETSDNKEKKVDMRFAVDKWFDVMDRDGVWYRGVIIAMDAKSRKVKVHFEGFPPKYDEIIGMDEAKFAPLDTRARNRIIDVRAELALPSDVVQIVCVHRRMKKTPNYFLTPLKPELFGAPMVIFVPHNITGMALYSYIWEKTRRYTTPPPLLDRQGSFFDSLAEGEKDSTTLKDLPKNGSDTPPTQSRKHHHHHQQQQQQESEKEKKKERNDDKNQQGEGDKEGKSGVRNDDEGDEKGGQSSSSSSSVLPPFVLKLTDRSGRISSVEPWNKFSFGTPIEFTKAPMALEDQMTISIDWNPSFVQKYLNMEELLIETEHKSVAEIALLPEPKVDIAMCFKLFTEKEDLSDEIYCSAVKKHLKASKKIEVFSAPPVLVVHLKRLLQRYKIQTFVDTPLTGFDMSPYLSSSNKNNHVSLQNLSDSFSEGKGHPGDGTDETKESTKPKTDQLYDLYAVINHYGSAYGGHYVAFAKSRKGSQKGWYCFDDSRVTRIKEKDVVTRHAYMLFYKRRDFDGLDFLPMVIRQFKDKPLTAKERRVLEEVAASDSRCMDATCGGNGKCVLS